jgi:hypothetical protein
MKRILAALALAFVVAAPALFAYNVKLKDGSIIFARSKYEVKGKKAIITLTNGTVTQLDIDLIDVAGTEQYNKDNPGNVIVLVPGDASAPTQPMATPVPTASLQDMIRKKKMQLGAPPPKSMSAPERSGTPGSWTQVEPAVDVAFRKVLDGAQITQYRLTMYRGKTRLLATANTEEAVFNILSASARALADLVSRGKDAPVEILLTTSSGDAAGNFEMTGEQARLLVNGQLAVADYFIRNVAL